MSDANDAVNTLSFYIPVITHLTWVAIALVFLLEFGSIAAYLIVHHLANIISRLQRHSTYTVGFDAAVCWLLCFT